MSALTPPSDMPTPTTDKITQAAMETIYLCKFRVSMDGEWLCLRELDDISLTPDPEPNPEDSWEDLTELVEQMRDDTEDPNYLMANERMNLMNMAKLSIKGLIESALNLGRTLDSDYAPLQQFFVVMEHCLKHGLKAKKTFLGQNKSFWGPLELVEKLVPEAAEITASVKDLPGLRTPVGRGRAWLRLALMQKKLSEYMKALINRKDLLSEFYEPNALMMEEEGAIISGLLVGLNVIDANFCMKGEDLDSQVGVIDFSMYLKEGPIAKCSEGDGQITAILDQKNYVEELNRQLSATVNNLQAKVDALEKSNTKLTEELAVANNRIITMQEEMERIKEETSYYSEASKKVNKQERTADGQALSEVKKHLKEETQLRLDIEKELEVQIGMRQEMELAMKMLDKDVCEKQDALAALRQQLDDLRALKHELSFKLQSSDLALKQKSELNSRLEEKTNQMAATVKQLEQRLRVSERDRQSAEEANKLFKQEFGDKIESLQLEVDRLRKHCSQYEAELKKDRNKHISSNHKGSPETKTSPMGGLLQRNRKKMVNEDIHQYREVDGTERPQSAVNEKNESQMSNSLSSSSSVVSESEDSVLETGHSQVCQLCQSEFSNLLSKNVCKNCGGIFCPSCSANELPLPSSINPERVCNPCHKKLIEQYSYSPS
ncbi:protein RUFY3 isoform X4 [Xenopus tropicalis]|uniref:Protein RUFY3 isoform X4 n=1 Tax=Xenopus tropicalis TaxID=8364 RepID=A0A6I8S8S2_XENTR|nr:protein RUFY3 isoform X4 [Xenopus tropicalis]|eukprot:XP_017949768.1 PREDICTED: protein RUFY3 isoform X4 [Xenopus tropicalis]